MKVFIFAIGGTGARVLRSLTYCLAADMGQFPNGTTFVPMIIDRDITNGDKSIALQTMEEYRAIHNRVYANFAYPGGGEYRCFFKAGMSYLTDEAVLQPGQQPNINGFEFVFNAPAGQTFANYLNAGNLIGNLQPSSYLLHALYNDEPTDSALTELNLDLAQGFVGNPNIGTMVFDKIRYNAAYKLFQQTFNPQTDCVVIVGSNFGGTGSSGIPKIIEAIRSNGAQGWDTAKVAAVIVQPYFKVGNPQAGVAKAIDHHLFNSKQKASLSYYDTSGLNNDFTAIYYVSENDNRQTTHNYAPGNDAQKNPANIVELVAATGIVDFVGKVAAAAGFAAPNNAYEYATAGSDDVDNQYVRARHFSAQEMAPGGNLRALLTFGMAMKYYTEHVKTGRIKDSNAYYNSEGLNVKANINGGIYDMLSKFADGFYKWIGELGTGGHPLMPFRDNAKDLNEYIVGYKPGRGNLLSTGVSYTEFDSFANKTYSTKEVAQYTNTDQAFLKVLYQGAIEEMSLTVGSATNNPNK